MDGPLEGPVLLQGLQLYGSHFPEGRLLAEEILLKTNNGMNDGDNGILMTSVANDPSVSGRLREGTPESPVALSGLARLMLVRIDGPPPFAFQGGDPCQQVGRCLHIFDLLMEACASGPR